MQKIKNGRREEEEMDLAKIHLKFEKFKFWSK
jgi:hypothetical protein